MFVSHFSWSPPQISHPSGESPQAFFKGLFLKIRPKFIAIIDNPRMSRTGNKFSILKFKSINTILIIFSSLFI